MRGTYKDRVRRQTNIVALCIAIEMLLLLLSGDLFVRDFCLSNAHGLRLTEGDTLVETTISIVWSTTTNMEAQ